VKIPATGKRLKFTAWVQPQKAPAVYIVPGLGAHRLGGTVLELAELVYGAGYTVVSVSNPYNHEFMEHASTAAMPAYTPAKASDLRSYAAGLRANPKIRIITHRNDFLLPAEDLAWLQTLLSPEQLTLFESGGHLGNLAQPATQKTILAALEGLGARREASHD